MVVNLSKCNPNGLRIEPARRKRIHMFCLRQFSEVLAHTHSAGRSQPDLIDGEEEGRRAHAMGRESRLKRRQPVSLDREENCFAIIDSSSDTDGPGVGKG